MAWSRIKGVSETIRVIRRLAAFLPPIAPDADRISETISSLHKRFPFLFIAASQKCLIRGFLIFFYGQRMKLNMRLQFGGLWADNELRIHCWILLEDRYFYEVPDVINEYELLVEYS